MARGQTAFMLNASPEARASLQGIQQRTGEPGTIPMGNAPAGQKPIITHLQMAADELLQEASNAPPGQGLPPDVASAVQEFLVFVQTIGQQAQGAGGAAPQPATPGMGPGGPPMGPMGPGGPMGPPAQPPF